MGGTDPKGIDFMLTEYDYAYLLKGVFYDVVIYDKSANEQPIHYGLLCFEDINRDAFGNIILLFTEYDLTHEQHVGEDGTIHPLHIMFPLSFYNLNMYRRYIEYT